MKDFIKFFSIITGLFRSIISILALFAIGFVIFVDNHLFLATVDLLGIKMTIHRLRGTFDPGLIPKMEFHHFDFIS